MSVLIEIVVGAVLSVFVTTADVEQNPSPEKVKSEIVSNTSYREEC